MAVVDDCPSRPTRAFTLVELLIVVALLVAIGALVVPTGLESLERRRFESSLDSIVGQLRLARAHARTTAGAVEVTVASNGRDAARLEVRTVDLRSMGAVDGADRESRAIEESWADVEYDVGIELEEALAAESSSTESPD